MSYIRNKDTLYMVVRYDLNDPNTSEVCCAITKTEEFASTLAGQYRQQMFDAGILTYDFYVQGQIYYDE